MPKKSRKHTINFQNAPSVLEKVIKTVSVGSFPATVDTNYIVFYHGDVKDIVIVNKGKTNITVQVPDIKDSKERWEGELVYIREKSPPKLGKYLYDREQRRFIANIGKRELFQSSGWNYKPPRSGDFDNLLVTDYRNFAEKALCYSIGGWGALAKILFVSKYVAKGVYGDMTHQVNPNLIGVGLLVNYYLDLFNMVTLPLPLIKGLIVYLFPASILEFNPSQLNALGQLLASPVEGGDPIAGTNFKVRQVKITDALHGNQFPFESGELVNLELNMRIKLEITKITCIGDKMYVFTKNENLTLDEIKKEFDLKDNVKLAIKLIEGGES